MRFIDSVKRARGAALIGYLRVAVLLAGLLVGLGAASAADQRTVDVQIRDLVFRFPRTYDVQGSTLPNSDQLGALWLEPPIADLPIIPQTAAWKNIEVKLTLHFESYEAARKR